MHINLDDLLETPVGRICTHERTAEALERCCTMLTSALERANDKTTVYVMVGAQASGKTTWARAKAAQDPDAILFDFIRVKKSERQPILAAARTAGVPVVAVWFKTSLADCLTRNAARSLSERVDEEALRNVFAALEPPSIEEGFARVHEVRNDADKIARRLFQRSAG
jgi:predicted kinase